MINSLAFFTSERSIYSTDLPTVSQNTVVNLSNTTHSEILCSVLKLISSFAISKQPSFSQLIAPTEKAFKNSRLIDTQKFASLNSRQCEFQFHQH